MQRGIQVKHQHGRSLYLQHSYLQFKFGKTDGKLGSELSSRPEILLQLWCSVLEVWEFKGGD